MDFRMTGLGSGFDIDKIVKAYVDAEKVPKEELIKEKRTKLEAQMSAYGQVESRVSALNTTLKSLSKPDIYSGKSIKMAEQDFFTATVHNHAYVGSHSIEVVTVAQAHQIATPGKIFFDYPTDLTVDEPSSPLPEQALGASGSLTVKVDGMGQTLEIDESMSLFDISQKLNDIEFDTPYVRSQMVFTADGAQLILIAEGMGKDNELSVTIEDEDIGGNAILTQLFGDANDLPDPLKPANPGDPSPYGVQEVKPATDAEVMVDGLRFTHTSNSFDNIIPGLDLDIQQAHGPSQPPTIMSIYVDQSEILGLLYAFVDQHNKTMETIDEYTYFGATEETRGPLVGDFLIRTIQKDIELRGVVTEDGLTLSQIGIRYIEGGMLEIDDVVLRDALVDENLNLKELFTDEEIGIASVMQRKTEAFIKIDGSFDQRQDSIDISLEDLVERQLQLDEMIAAREKMLYQKFNLMDEIVDRMEKTREHLKNLFDTLPGVGNSKKKD